MDEAYLSIGEAIARSPDESRPWTIIVPFALPGEKIKARIYRNSRLHSFADLVEVITPNTALRDDNRVRCQYFGTCGGCQYQVHRTAISDVLPIMCCVDVVLPDPVRLETRCCCQSVQKLLWCG